MNKKIAVMLSLLLLAAPVIAANAYGEDDADEEVELSGPAAGREMRGEAVEQMRIMKGHYPAEMMEQSGMKGRKKMMGRHGRGGMMNRGMNSNRMKKFGKRIKFTETKTLNIIKKNDTEFFKTLKKLKSSNPRQYKFLMITSSRLLKRIKFADNPSSEKDVVEAIKLEYETRNLSKKYKKASKSEQASIKKQLSAKIAKLFDLREKGREAKIKAMEKNLKEMKQKIKDRKAHKSEIVKSRLGELLGEGYRW